MASLTDPKIARKISDTASCYGSVMDIIINDILNPAIEIAGKRGFRHIVITPVTIRKYLPEFGDILSFRDFNTLVRDAVDKANAGKKIGDTVYAFKYQYGGDRYLYWGTCGNITTEYGNEHGKRIYLIKDNDLPER